VSRIVLDPPTDLLARVEDRIAGLAPHKIDAALVSVRRPLPFHALSAAQQDAMLAAWCDSPLAQARTLYQLLRRLALSTHYADPATHAAIGYRGALHLRPPAVSWEGPAAARTDTGDDEPVLRLPAPIPVATPRPP
jgi:hypothetical protein